MSGIGVRPVQPGDGAGCARAWLDAGRYYVAIDPDRFQIPAADGLAEWFEQANASASPDSLQLVGCVDDDVAGFVAATLRLPVPGPERQLLRTLRHPHVYVDALVVAARYRRAGVGTSLMDAVETWALERGAAYVVLDTYVNSPASIPFYEHQGYARTGVVFRKQLVPSRA
jgi:GNAT superfamily N-acetyltransferase